MAEMVNTGAQAYAAGKYRLEADIDMSALLFSLGRDPWTPIQDFRGALDGNGHQIYNFNADFSSLSAAGLFDTISQRARVYDLTLSGGIPLALSPHKCLATQRRTGLLCATLSGQVENVTVQGSIETAGGYAGGLAGYVTALGSIENCRGEASVSGQDTCYVGGIAGWLDGGAISGCVSSRLVLARTDRNGTQYTGGIAGRTANNGTITLCRSLGSVSGGFAGGVTGALESTVSRCASSGSIDGSNAGGIVGKLESGAVEDCYAAGFVSGVAIVTASGTVNAGGIAALCGGGAVSLCYSIARVESAGAAGGIAADLSGGGSLLHCAALNPVVSGTSASGRVAALPDGLTLGGNCFGFTGITASSVPGAGTDVEKQTVWEASFWKDQAGFDLDSIWTKEKDCLSCAASRSRSPACRTI